MRGRRHLREGVGLCWSLAYARHCGSLVDHDQVLCSPILNRVNIRDCPYSCPCRRNGSPLGGRHGAGDLYLVRDRDYANGFGRGRDHGHAKDPGRNRVIGSRHYDHLLHNLGFVHRPAPVDDLIGDLRMALASASCPPDHMIPIEGVSVLAHAPQKVLGKGLRVAGRRRKKVSVPESDIVGT